MDRLDEHLRWLIAAPIYVCAYAAAALAFWQMARRRGMATDGIARVMAAGIIGGLAGANLLQLLATGLPGKTIEGGIVGGWLAVIWMKRRLGITRPTGDLFALAIPAGEAIGRIACFVGGCCYGKMMTFAVAVHDHGAWRHPAQLYLSLASVMTFAILTAIERRRILPENGLFYLGGVLFCIDR
ncbi:MAG TPA: prolipoprotein diacylglyceryl transferase family protein, partial [Candidatus Cybelea sp.]